MSRSSSDSIDTGSLQFLQATFDRSRGFDFPAAARPDQLLDAGHDARLRSIEFATMALAGEIGELANQVKKARRELWTGGDPELNTQAATAELGDIYAYLLKLSSALGADLEVRYLIRACENYLRFPPRPLAEPTGRIIPICGPPGVGKTTTVGLVGRPYSIYTEDASLNPQLDKWLNGAADFDAAEHQGWFVDTMGSFITSQESSADLILDQEPLAFGLVYGHRFWTEGRLTDSEFKELLVRVLGLEAMLSRWRSGRIVVWLDAPAKILRKRLLTRDSGRAPAGAWLDQVRRQFAYTLRNTPNVIRISTDDASPDEVVRAVIGQVQGSGTLAAG